MAQQVKELTDNFGGSDLLKPYDEGSEVTPTKVFSALHLSAVSHTLHTDTE